MNPCTIASCKDKPMCQGYTALGYCPTPTEGMHLDITKTLLVMKDALPTGYRVQSCSTMAVILLGDQIPTNRDIDACIGFLRAMKASVK